MLAQPQPSSDSRSLRILVYKEKSRYVGECLDFDIAVREKTDRLALKSIVQAVNARLRTADDPSPRNAPLLHYARYYAYLAFDRLRVLLAGPPTKSIAHAVRKQFTR